MYFLQVPQTETTIRARIRGGSVGQLPGAPTFRALTRHWHKRKYSASKLWFPHEKEFILKLSAIWASDLKIFSTPIQ